MQIGKFLKNIYVKNLLIAVLIFLVLVFAILSWLKVYTQHGEAVEVPDVKGLQLEKAEAFFTSKDLFFQVIDSTFSKSAIPGSILETVPPIGAKVKKGRTIYLKINSFTAQLITVPDVKDLSQRQAFGMSYIVGIHDTNVFSFRSVQALIAAFVIARLRWIVYPDNSGIVYLIQNSASFICRCIVYDNQFKIGKGLFEDAAHGNRCKQLHIPHRHDYRNSWCLYFSLHLLVINLINDIQHLIKVN